MYGYIHPKQVNGFTTKVKGYIFAGFIHVCFQSFVFDWRSSYHHLALSSFDLCLLSGSHNITFFFCFNLLLSIYEWMKSFSTFSIKWRGTRECVISFSTKSNQEKTPLFEPNWNHHLISLLWKHICILNFVATSSNQQHVQINWCEYTIY